MAPNATGRHVGASRCKLFVTRVLCCGHVARSTTDLSAAIQKIDGQTTTSDSRRLSEAGDRQFANWHCKNLQQPAVQVSCAE